MVASRTLETCGVMVLAANALNWKRAEQAGGLSRGPRERQPARAR